MDKNKLLELIRNGENSGVEFKRDDVHPQSVAKEIVSLSNLEGGHLLIGVDDDGVISGINHANIEEWIMNICANNIQPLIIPYFEIIHFADNKKVAVLTIPADSPDKPYKARQGNRWITFVRIGSTAREASREEEQRLYQASGVIRYDIKPVPGSTIEDLDIQRLGNYFKDIRRQDCPEKNDIKQWETLLVNTEIMTISREIAMPTVGGMLLFGRNPNRYLPQAGITAVAYQGLQKDYDAIERVTIRGPIVARLSNFENIIDAGIVEQTIAFIRRNTHSLSFLQEGRRIDKLEYPEEAIRETIVNAIAHRDYTISGTDIELSIYKDWLEVISPGRLPNTVTVDRMRTGCRATRNELVKEVLRDYHYIEATGLGVPRKIIAGMLKHNGSEPDLIEEEYSFMVRLWNKR